LNIKKSNFLNLNEISAKDGPTSEGLVLLGCGRQLKNGIHGISNELYEAGVTTNNKPTDLWKKIYKVNNKNKRIDLIFLFNDDFSHFFNLSKLIIWRIKKEELIWFSDYIREFAIDYEEYNF